MLPIYRLLLIVIPALLLCSCEYAKPEPKEKEKATESSRSTQSDTSGNRQKPAYVVAQPTDEQDLTGINGGQRFTFEPPDYGGEWTQDNSTDRVRFFVLDRNGSKNVALEAESFCIKTPDNLLFSLDPDEHDPESGSHSFSLDDRNLALAMNSTVEVFMAVAGKSYRAVLNESQSSSSASTELQVDD